MKYCPDCKQTKDAIYFGIANGTPTGLQTYCKECRAAKLKLSTAPKKYKELNAEKIKIQQSKYLAKNKELILAKNRDRYKENRDYHLKRAKIYVINNAGKVASNKSAHYHANKDIIREKFRNYRKLRLKNDYSFKFQHSVRGLLLTSFSRACEGQFAKDCSSAKILGCSMAYFMDYIAGKFTDGMSWDNRIKWHLDHIIPISSATTNEEIINLNHWTNFQPLWANDNIKKGCKLDWKQG